MLRNSSNEEKCKFLLENGKYDSVKIIKYLKNNQLIEIDKTFITQVQQPNLTQLINNFIKKDTETLYHINESIKNNDFTYFDDKKEILDCLYQFVLKKLNENYPKYRKKIYKFMKERENEFFGLDNFLKCKVIFEIVQIMKRGNQYIDLPFEPYNLKRERIGRLNGQSISLETTYFYDVSITGIYSKKYKLLHGEQQL